MEQSNNGTMEQLNIPTTGIAQMNWQTDAWPDRPAILSILHRLEVYIKK